MVLLGVLLAGCDDPATPTTRPDNVQAVAPSTAPATTTAPTTRPQAVMTIDQLQILFPPAILRLKKTDEKFRVYLVSDDPREAFKPDYTGNSFYFELPELIDETSDLAITPIILKSDAQDRRDTTEGIFLNGSQYQLQPLDAKIQFAGEGEELTVYISGTFLRFDTRGDTPGQVIPVAARLSAMVKTPSR